MYRVSETPHRKRSRSQFFFWYHNQACHSPDFSGHFRGIPAQYLSYSLPLTIPFFQFLVDVYLVFKFLSVLYEFLANLVWVWSSQWSGLDIVYNQFCFSYTFIKKRKIENYKNLQNILIKKKYIYIDLRTIWLF